MNASYAWPASRLGWRFWLLFVAFCGILFSASFATAQEAPPLGEEVKTAESPAPKTEAPEKTQAASAEDPAPQNRGIPSMWRKLISNVDWYYWTPFLIATVIAICFGIERLVVLRKGRVIPRAFVDRFLQHLEQNQLEQDGAVELCESNNSPVASVFAHGVRKWGKPSVEVEQAIIDGGERQVSQLRKHLRVLNGVSTVTPLMGLLGTVIGMMLAFVALADLYPLTTYMGLTIGPDGVVEAVKADSPAGRAGVTTGGEITKVDGTAISDNHKRSSINATFENMEESADAVTVTVSDGGTEKQFKLPLQENWYIEATDKAFRLANGIVLALVTTVLGLVVAIPSLIFYMYLAGRVDSLVMEMDLLAQDVVHLISMEALAKDAGSSTRTRRRSGSSTKKKAV